MKETKKRLDEFFQASYQYLEINNGRESKLIYALGRMRKKLKTEYENYLDQVQDERISLASTNDKGDLIINGKQYDFKPDKLKEFNRKVKQIQAQEFEFEPYYATELPKELPYTFKELFINFVIQETEEP